MYLASGGIRRPAPTARLPGCPAALAQGSPLKYRKLGTEK